ncbi:TMS membrane protein/tumor differentially expressed protein [Terfezia boudieri ATCC MYA-4762]|uniref:TMS membrane protein/tumor differentially expressed protein n=1 Tax=Terfezia boudieri ATCC MYA-4762 TaxID=1051890 RepID=A0A3N4LRG0_9PEZI|nr:TMS membrane protein/tumor differentially expressed protein [Terfezia boudieri ATCC MYA-4762]
MGGLLSLPLLAFPGVGSIGGCLMSCCGAYACSAIFSACGKCGNSIATRIVYALIFLVNSIISWVMLTPWAIKKLEHLTLDYLPISCFGEQCYGFVAVHRINFALGVFHLIMALLLIGVTDSRHPRAAIQNGYWGIKIFAWIGLVIFTFLIPEGFFIVWGNYFATIGAFLFLLLGLILLVDLAHSWAETCLEKIEFNDSPVWRFILIGSTLGMYIGSIVMTIVMYIFFGGSDCSTNLVWITLNIIMVIIVSCVSVHPTVQYFNSQAGLAQSAMVAIYCTYLTMSAVSMEPDDKHCNPLLRARGTRTASIVMGALITILTIAYTTTRAATQGVALGSSNGGEYSHIVDGEQLQPSRKAIRTAALRQAVDSGSLPASALDDDSDDEDDSYGGRNDDEKMGTQYPYTWFHVIFLLATSWVATLLTMQVETDLDGDFAPIGRTYTASWVKVVSAWVCYTLYTWTLVAPALFPDRFS